MLVEDTMLKKLEFFLKILNKLISNSYVIFQSLKNIIGFNNKLISGFNST